MPFVPMIPDEPQARRVVQYSAPVDTTVHHACVMCDAPVRRSGRLCRNHYYFEAVQRRGRQWPGHGFIRRPGLWLPPIILVVTIVLALYFIGSMAIFWCFFGPFFMHGWVFGMKNNRKDGETGVPHMLQPQQPDGDVGW